MNLQTDCNLLTEGKSYGGRRVFASEKSTLMSTLVRLIGSLKANLDKKMIAKAVSDYGTLKEEFKDALFGILGAYQKGEIAEDVLESMWRSEIKDGWQKAYEFGVRSVGNPFGIWEEDKSWLKGAEAEEFGYLGKFVDDIKNNELVMGLEDRLEMYTETLDGVFNHGKVDGSPDFVEIDWILRESRHCADCIRFAAGSPYTRKTLPAVPRDGSSRCLSSCMCELRFRYVEQKPAPEMFIIKGPKPVVAPEGYRLPSDKERDRLNTMYAEIERVRGLIQATKGDIKKGYIQTRRDINQAMIDYMEKHKLYYVPGVQVQKQKISEVIADEMMKGLLFEGGAGSGAWGHEGRPGRVGGSLPGSGVGEVSVSSDFSKINVSDLASWDGDRSPYAQAAYYRVQGNPNYVGVVMKEGDETVGIASLFVRDRKKTIEIDRLATKRKGFGVKMMKEICRIASEKEYGILVGADAKAIGFYQKIGMKKEGAVLFSFSKEGAHDFAGK